MSNEQIQYLPLDKIKAERQVRETFSEETIRGLAESMTGLQQLQPIRVRKVGDEYVIVDGERRYRAAKLAGRPTIAAIVESKEVGEAETLHRQWVANCQREDLSPLEKARGLAKLMTLAGWSSTQAAAKLGLSNANVTRLLALLTLPQQIQDRVASGEIAASGAYELSRIDDPAKQADLATQMAEGRLTRDGVSGARKAAKRAATTERTGASTRATALLGAGRSVTVSCADMNLERFLETLEELVAKARKIRPRGIELPTFLKMLRDEAKA